MLKKLIYILSILCLTPLASYAQKAIDRYGQDTLTKEEERLIDSVLRTNSFGNCYHARVVSMEGDSIDAGLSLMKVDPEYLVFAYEQTPETIDTFLTNYFKITGAVKAAYIDTFLKSYKAPKSKTYLEFKKMHNEDQAFRTREAGNHSYVFLDSLADAYRHSDSGHFTYLYNYVKKKGWPSLADGSLWACVIAIHDHAHHRYYLPILKKAVIEGKVPVSVLGLVLSWLNMEKNNDHANKLLKETLATYKYTRFKIDSVYEYKLPDPATIQQIRDSIKALCPVRYILVQNNTNAKQLERQFLSESIFEFWDNIKKLHRQIISSECLIEWEGSIDKVHSYNPRNDLYLIYGLPTGDDSLSMYLYLISEQKKIPEGPVRDTFHVYFALNDTALDNDALETLSTLSLRKDAASTDTLIIMGYADMLGKDQHNEWLSTARAQRVKDRLVAQGISQTAFKLCIGRGAIKRDTVAPKEGFQSDRRVDIIAPKGIVIKKRIPTYVKRGMPFTTDSFDRGKKGDLFVLQKVQFVANRHKYVGESEKELDELCAALKKNTSTYIRIEGHVCCIPPGHDADDWDIPRDLTKEDLRIEENTLSRFALSQNRAWKVRNYLIRKGINPERITYTGYGSNRPAFKEDTREGREKNMRVEVRVTQK